jgi:hypothetical protein
MNCSRLREGGKPNIVNRKLQMVNGIVHRAQCMERKSRES